MLLGVLNASNRTSGGAPAPLSRAGSALQGEGLGGGASSGNPSSPSYVRGSNQRDRPQPPGGASSQVRCSMDLFLWQVSGY